MCTVQMLFYAVIRKGVVSEDFSCFCCHFVFGFGFGDDESMQLLGFIGWEAFFLLKWRGGLGRVNLAVGSSLVAPRAVAEGILRCVTRGTLWKDFP